MKSRRIASHASAAERMLVTDARQTVGDGGPGAGNRPRIRTSQPGDWRPGHSELDQILLPASNWHARHGSCMQ